MMPRQAIEGIAVVMVEAGDGKEEVLMMELGYGELGGVVGRGVSCFDQRQVEVWKQYITT